METNIFKVTYQQMCAVQLSHFNHVQLFAILWTIAQQIPLSTGFFMQECWSGLPCPSPGDLPDSVIEPSQFSNPARFLTFPALGGEFFKKVILFIGWFWLCRVLVAAWPFL